MIRNSHWSSNSLSCQASKIWHQQALLTAALSHRHERTIIRRKRGARSHCSPGGGIGRAPANPGTTMTSCSPLLRLAYDSPYRLLLTSYIGLEINSCPLMRPSSCGMSFIAAEGGIGVCLPRGRLISSRLSSSTRRLCSR